MILRCEKRKIFSSEFQKKLEPAEKNPLKNIFGTNVDHCRGVSMSMREICCCRLEKIEIFLYFLPISVTQSGKCERTEKSRGKIPQFSQVLTSRKLRSLTQTSKKGEKFAKIICPTVMCFSCKLQAAGIEVVSCVAVKNWNSFNIYLTSQIFIFFSLNDFHLHKHHEKVIKYSTQSLQFQLFFFVI